MIKLTLVISFVFTTFLSVHAQSKKLQDFYKYDPVFEEVDKVPETGRPTAHPCGESIGGSMW